MNVLESIEQYHTLTKEIHDRCKRLFSNIYLFDDSLKRYISAQRLFYHQFQDGILFISDEKTYYRIYFLISSSCNEVNIPNFNKNTVTRMIYRGEKKDNLIATEKILLNNGFNNDSSSLEILARPCSIENLESKYQISCKYMERFGIKLIYADRSMYNDIIELIRSEPVFRFYHLDYVSKEEILRDIDLGYYRCAIDQNGVLCAVQHFNPCEGRIIGDILTVRKEYRNNYGIGAAMGFQSLIYAKEKGIDSYFGWIDSCNHNSIKYHEEIGYSLTGKISEEWIKIT